ncbi:TetR/AcrR family transcriptional regulator [Neobacillus sp. BF23-41]
MSKIAEKSNVSSSTIYVYFENKEDMLNKLYLTFKKKMSQRIFKG